MEAVRWWVVYCYFLEYLQTLGADNLDSLTCASVCRKSGRSSEIIAS